MTYSEDFRKQVLSHIDAGATIKAVSELFSVGTTTIKNWKKMRTVLGSVTRRQRTKKAYKINEGELLRYIKCNPDAFLHEIAFHFKVTPPAIFIALKRLNITRKKSPRSTKSGATKREKNT